MTVPSGRRFRAHYERMRAKPGMWRTVIAIGGGLVLIALGIVMLVTPGPGLIVAAIGAALIAGESLVAARDSGSDRSGRHARVGAVAGAVISSRRDDQRSSSAHTPFGRKAAEFLDPIGWRIHGTPARSMAFRVASSFVPFCEPVGLKLSHGLGSADLVVGWSAFNNFLRQSTRPRGRTRCRSHRTVRDAQAPRLRCAWQSSYRPWLPS